MKKILPGLALCVAVAFAGCSAIDASRATSAGIKAVQALTVSDAQIKQYTKQFIDANDAESAIAAANDPYAIRLNKITAPFNNRDGINIKVYKTKDVNAFATADGSIRVYSGLMDIMTDEQILGVIGHEIGHVMNKDTKDAFKNALLISALRDGVASAGGAVGALSASQMGDLGEAFASSQYSQKQEYAADDYGYNFLKAHGINPWAMALALDKLRQMEQQGSSGGAINQLFSTHPDISNRMNRLADRAAKEGYLKPGAGGSLNITPAGTGKTTGNTGTSSQWSF